MTYFIDSIFFSYAQIFFSNRRWFGIAAMLITFVSPEIGALGLLGALITNTAAIALNFDREKIRTGIYGFNGILFAAAAGFFLEITPDLIALVVIFVLLLFFITASLEHLMTVVFNLPHLSIPFIVTFYIFQLFLLNTEGIIYNDMSKVFSENLGLFPYQLSAFFKSISIILLQSNEISGLLLTLLILFFSRVMFINILFAYLLNAVLVSFMLGTPSEELVLLTSFNALLTAIALGGSMIIVSKKTLLLLLISTVFVIIFSGFFSVLLKSELLPVLVLPFNLVVLATIYSLKYREQHSPYTLLYFKPGSPEENYYYHKNRITRFEGFKYMFPELPFWGEWKVTQGIEGNITHKDDWKYAWDFVITDEEGSEYSGDGKSLTEYYCFDKPVLAPLDGRIVKVIDNIKDNEIGEFNLKQNWGNTIIIDHGEGLFSASSHLKKNSSKVTEGDDIKKGEILAQCGNSGRSPYPHLHFQFQLSNKVGAKTYKFPFSHYLSKNLNEFGMHSFEYPVADSIVQNIETTKNLKNAFNFELGDKISFSCSLNGRELDENWEVKVDIFNQMYIENNKGSKLFIYTNEKVFYAANYVGEKRSALYFFYIGAISLPLGYYDRLSWKDQYPVSLTVNSLVKYVAELFLIFGDQIKSTMSAEFKLIPGKVTLIELTQKNKGNFLFTFFHEYNKAQITISDDGTISKFQFKSRETNFYATSKSIGERHEISKTQVFSNINDSNLQLSGSGRKAI